MDVQYELWKTELGQGKIITIPVNTDRLAPLLSRGDKVEVKKVPSKEINLNDVVFCLLNGKAGLRRISNVRSLYGNHSLEAADDDGTMKPLAESAILGKAVKMHRKNEVARPLTPTEKVLRTLKKIFLPGT